MIEVTLVVCAGLIAALLLSRQPAALRHWVLAVALACAAAVPLFQLVVPAWRSGPVVAMSGAPSTSAVQVVRLSAEAATDSGPRASARQETQAGPSAFDRVRSWPWRAIAAAIWIAGVIVSLGVLAAGAGRLRWLAARSRRLAHGPWPECAAALAADLDLRRPITILESDRSSLLVTWGLHRPRVMVPKSALAWEADRIRIVLCHELAHIARADWVTQLLAELLRSVYWFNPIVWIASRCLRHESERACDDAVLRSGVQASAYAGHLVALARELRPRARPWLDTTPAPAMVRPSSLERRVRAMLNGSLDRRQSSGMVRASMAAALVGLTAVVVSLSAAQGPAFSGSVVDPQNSGVADVQISVTNVESQAKTEVKSDQNGRFSVPTLPAGTYVVEAQRPGFRAIREQFTLSVNPVERKYSLVIGTVSESITVMFDPAATASAPPAAAPARAAKAPAQQCTSTSSGGNIRPPMKLKHVPPVYPSHLAGSGSEASVVLESRIRTDGTPDDLRVVKSAGSDFDAAALESVRQWVFAPTLLNCVPVDVLMTVTVKFVEKK
jgi:TonB family protein